MCYSKTNELLATRANIITYVAFCKSTNPLVQITSSISFNLYIREKCVYDDVYKY